ITFVGIDMKEIKVIDMCGTISGNEKDRFDLKDYKYDLYNEDEFVEAISEIEQIADVSFESILRVSSTILNADHWIQLRKKVTTCLLEENFDGIVITHGTNTLEESAYFLHLTVPTDKPIVFVGAQRPFTAL